MFPIVGLMFPIVRLKCGVTAIGWVRRIIIAAL
jgi:hypothetical protein